MPTLFGLPVSARWPDPSEELAGLREFRADYDRLMATEGQSHGEAIAALSGVLASVRQRPAPDDVDRLAAALAECEARCNALADRVTAAEGRMELAAMERDGVPRG